MDVRMGVSHSSAVVGDDVRNLLLANALFDDLAQLETGLFLVDLVGLETTFQIVENSEVLIGFLNSHNIHLAQGISGVSSDLSVNLNHTLLILDDLSGLISVRGVLESLLQQHGKRDALSQLVGSGGRSGSVDSLQLGEEPPLGGGNSLDNLSLSFIALNEAG